MLTRAGDSIIGRIPMPHFWLMNGIARVPTGPSSGRFWLSADELAYVVRLASVGRGYMTFATPSRSIVFWVGIATVAMSKPACRC
jgi:hypothetical protein